jgi:hypothetical protein
MEGVNGPKYTTAEIHWETPSNINLNINDDRQGFNIGTMCGGVGGRVNEGY